MIGREFSHYIIEERLGSGGMGEVFRARDTKLRRSVAVKLLHPELSRDESYRRRFIGEARNAALVNHAGIAGIYDILECDGEICLVMEYVQGRTLNHCDLDNRDVELFLELFLQCAEALAAAHRLGVVHRDVKPGNIMLTRESKIKILDFGLAKRREREADPRFSEEITTQDGGIRGTPAYMAPEVLTGREADNRSDIFSLGVVFFELLSDQHPFRDSTQAGTINRILSGEPPRLSRLNPWIPEELDHVIDKMLQKDPRVRYASADDLVADLRRIARDLSVKSLPRDALPQERGRNWRRVLLLAGLGLAAVAILLYSGLLYRLPLDWPLPDNPTVAIFPSEISSPREEIEYFGVGLSEALNRALGKASADLSINVIPSGMIRDRGVSDASELPRKLGANLALVSELEYARGNVRIRMDLLSADSGRRLRTGTVEGTQDRPIDLQYALAGMALSLLDVRSTDEHKVELIDYHRSQASYNFFLKGLGYQVRRDVPRAIDSFREALTLDDKFGRAHAYLGLAYLEQARDGSTEAIERAQDHCETALKLDPGTAEAHLCLGEIHLFSGRPNEAFPEFVQAHHEGPLDQRVLDRLLLTHERLGRRTEMIPLLEVEVERRPEFWLPRSYLAYLLFREAEYRKAVPHYQQIIDLAPEYFPSYNALAACFAELGCPEKAIAVWEEALEIERESSLYTNLATANFYTGRYREALSYAEQAIVYLNDTPASARTYKDYGNLADILYWSPGGDRDKAALAYREAFYRTEEYLGKYPGDLEASGYRAWYQISLGHRDSALETLEKALGEGGLGPEITYVAALVYQAAGMTERAGEFLKLSLENGFSVKKATREPLFRNSAELSDLIREYPAEEQLCP